MSLLARQYRGELVDLTHNGHIVVADTDGNVLYKTGDANRGTFARSSAKPMQAIPLVESGAIDKFGITQKELAVMCASHNAEEFHVSTIRSILSKAGLDESYLQCGSHYPYAGYVTDEMKAKGMKPTNIHNNCSGKHTGMLITAQALGESLDDYYLPEHPVQKRILEAIAFTCDIPAEDIVIGCDGCGVPVHAMPLYKFAQGFARLSKPEVFDENRAKTIKTITDAMTAYPEMVAGTGRFCTELMQKFGDKLFSKGGAACYYAIGLKDKGIGITLKMENGSEEIWAYAVLEALVQIGVITREESKQLPSFMDNNMYNVKKQVVGRTEMAFELEKM